MATSPTSIVNSVLQNMLAGTQSKQAQQGLNLRQQQVDIEKQQEQRAQQQAELELHEGLTRLGAVAGDAQTGLINDPETGILRKMDPARTTRFKDSTGRPVAYEIPPVEQQVKRQFQAQNQPDILAAKNRQAQAEAQAQATGTAAGVTAGKQADLEARGVPLSQDDVTRFGMPDAAVGMRMLPEQIDQLSGRIVPAATRAKTAKEIADDKNAAAMARTNAITQRDKDLADAKTQAAGLLAEHKLQMQDAWQKARTSISANTSANLNNRVLMQQFDGQQKLHGLLTDQAYKETQRQLEAQALLDPKDGTQDGEEFTNPFTGKKNTMNGAMRIVLRSALGNSQAQLASLSNRAQAIEQRYGLSGQPAQGGDQRPGAGTPARGGAVPVSATPSTPNSAARGTGPEVAAANRASQQPTGAGGNTAPAKYKVGDTRTYNGGTYTFDGRQWVLQQAGIKPR
jgi:hypothetical protein